MPVGLVAVIVVVVGAVVAFLGVEAERQVTWFLDRRMGGEEPQPGGGSSGVPSLPGLGGVSLETILATAALALGVLWVLRH